VTENAQGFGGGHCATEHNYIAWHNLMRVLTVLNCLFSIHLKTYAYQMRAISLWS